MFLAAAHPNVLLLFRRSRVVTVPTSHEIPRSQLLLYLARKLSSRNSGPIFHARVFLFATVVRFVVTLEPNPAFTNDDSPFFEMSGITATIA